MRIRTALIVIVILFGPRLVHAGVMVTEVAWMGTSVSTADEWIELQNTDSVSVNLEGWTLEWGTVSSPKIVALSGSIASGGYYLLERTDDTTVPTVTADVIYSGSLSNTGEILLLKQDGVEKYRLDASSGWMAGDNTTKDTMQWTGSSWVTALATPKAKATGSAPPTPEGDDEEETNTTINQTSSSAVIDSTGALSVLRVTAGRDRSAVVGAPLSFEALTTDGSGRIIDANVSWSFGDGGSASGKKVSRSYKFPGTYVVVATADSGILSAQARFTVRVVPLAVVVSKASPGPTGFVELENKSSSEVNIGGLRVFADGVLYVMPSNTIILAGEKIVIPNSLTGMYTMQMVALELNDGTRVVPKDGTVVPTLESVLEEKRLRENEVFALQNKVATLASALASSRQPVVSTPAKSVPAPPLVANSSSTNVEPTPPVIVIEKKRSWWRSLPASIIAIFR